MSNANAARRFLVTTILDLESRASAITQITKEKLRLLRAAATYRNCQTMRGVWVD